MKKRRIKYIAILTLIPILLLTGCSNSPFEFNIMNELFAEFEEPETPDVEIPSDYERPVPAEDMNEAYADFSVELFKRSLTAGENSLISPASVEFALVMALNGADGDTLTEMLTVLCPGATTEEINAFVADLNSMLTYSSGSEFYVANSVWSNETILGDCLNETYANTLKEDMNAEAHMLPFDAKAVDEINDWVDENTDGMITELLKEIPPDAAMYLINAMTFDAKWSEAYEEYQIREGEVFTNAFSGIWWAVSTLLTVGYGDIYPITPIGQMFSIVITFLGVGMVAIPTGIISAGFVDQYSRLKYMSEYAVYKSSSW